MTILGPISGYVPILRSPISCHQDTISCHFSRYRTRYWQYRRRYRDNIGTYPFLAKPDITNIVPDIGFFPDIGYDICSISGHTRSLPYPISGFHRYRARYGPDIAKNIGIYGYRDLKNLDVVPYVYTISQYTDIVYFLYRAFFLILGMMYNLLRLLPPPAPAAQALKPLSRRSNRSSLLVRVLSSADQRGSVMGTAFLAQALQTKGAVPWVLPTSLRTAWLSVLL